MAGAQMEITEIPEPEMKDTGMTTLEQLKWAIEVHGAAWVAKWAKRKGINIDDVLVAVGAPRVGVQRQAAVAAKK